MGIEPIAVYSEADRHSPHVLESELSFCLGPPPAAQSYLDSARILDAARALKADAVHPGYGFLSENANFARDCEKNGLRFIGPRPEQIEAFGQKHVARDLAARSGVPVVPGTSLLQTVAEALEAAEGIGYPAMLKSTAGGGGIGMRRCNTPEELAANFESVARLAGASFGESSLFLEKLVTRARHIEVQIFGCFGEVIALGERDCSLQRRNQKVVEETPAPGLTPAIRRQMLQAAVQLARTVGYQSAGTVEFLYDVDTGDFYFLEVNTRLQVEHGVTEAVTGVDLVEWMVREAAGEDLHLANHTIQPRGAAIEVRVYAEDPLRGFQPCSGLLTRVEFPDNVRTDTWVETGTDVLPYYDPLLAKLIVSGNDRDEAVWNLSAALAKTRLDGLQTNLPYLREIAASDAFAIGAVDTGFLSRLPFAQRAIEVIDGGMQTSVQDYPGRLGYWGVGVPPSGPMDSFAFRLANRLVGNPESAAALEITMIGPSLRFRVASRIALAGARMDATLDGQPVPWWEAVDIPAGVELRIGPVQQAGARAYLAVAGGLDVPSYLGSGSTFLLGGFGGHSGRSLRPGDVLLIGQLEPENSRTLEQLLRPEYSNQWLIAALCGPHGAPDFFEADYLETFFSSDWTVHFHSDRTGVRLIGPKPGWARSDGGEAGLHPSNLHDNAYAVGTIDFTGDMPIILGPDGPSLGGFVCPATIVHADLWKIGQFRGGDTVRFHRVSYETAVRMERDLDVAVSSLHAPAPTPPIDEGVSPEILRSVADMVVRSDGDRYFLIELGPNVLDLELRLRVHALQQAVEELKLPGIIDSTAGIRSLQLHYDTKKISRETLLDAVDACYRNEANPADIEIPARTIHLPLSWDDPATREAIDRYTRTVNPHAPWAPSNIEFIRRINGLASVEDVHRIFFDASYVVLGLGDVYLGAPVATPMDPRHRLVTTKYNPARTWTPQNAVGIGGAYLCVYGMEGPGGYQFVGRTVQVWNTWRTTKLFKPGCPWLLRFFDQIRFYPVEARELLKMRDAFPFGKFEPKVENNAFRLRDYRALTASVREEAAQFRKRRERAFAEELDRWASLPERPEFGPDMAVAGEESELRGNHRAVSAPVTASVWRINAEPGQTVSAGQTIIILEAMKTEIAVVAPIGGTIDRILCKTGALITAGQRLAVIRGEE